MATKSVKLVNNDSCPFCDGDDTNSLDLSLESSQIRDYRSCQDCRGEWVNIYTYSVTEIDKDCPLTAQNLSDTI